MQTINTNQEKTTVNSSFPTSLPNTLKTICRSLLISRTFDTHRLVGLLSTVWRRRVYFGPPSRDWVPRALFGPSPFRSGYPMECLQYYVLIDCPVFVGGEGHLLLSITDLDGMNEATNIAQMTRKAPKTNGGPGTSWNFKYVSNTSPNNYNRVFHLTWESKISGEPKSETFRFKGNRPNYRTHFLVYRVPNSECILKVNSELDQLSIRLD